MLRELYVRWTQPAGIIVDENLRSRAPGDEDFFPEDIARAYEKVGLVKILDKGQVRKLGAKR